MDERAKPGDEVGLGHVVEDSLPPDATTEVDEASEDSFPASDPPGFTRVPATPTDERESPVTEGDSTA